MDQSGLNWIQTVLIPGFKDQKRINLDPMRDPILNPNRCGFLDQMRIKLDPGLDPISDSKQLDSNRWIYTSDWSPTEGREETNGENDIFARGPNK